METTLPTDPTTDPAQLLEVLQLQTHQVWACKRQNNPTALEQPLDTLLSLLEDIIQQSYDRYVALEGEEKSAMQAYHVKQASQMVYPLLVKIVSGEVTDNARVDRTAKVLSHLSGRGAAGAMIGTWHFSCLDSHGKETVVSLKIHEPSYIGNDIGFKTWGAAPLMAK
ncbi:hypothetical protein BDF14DRAFT_820233 [Spinellus fusiger]|nr:hypothetical protein BDF14DRAFT_820233 [Spinellus fusiger]